jgi:hypothetical protein
MPPETIPVLRPLLPQADRLLPYLRRIDASRIYTNWGPLASELECRLSGQFGLTDGEREQIRARDWIGLWRGGMSIYVMVKLSGVTNTPLPEIGRQMRESG